MSSDDGSDVIVSFVPEMWLRVVLEDTGQPLSINSYAYAVESIVPFLKVGYWINAQRNFINLSGQVNLDEGQWWRASGQYDEGSLNAYFDEYSILVEAEYHSPPELVIGFLDNPAIWGGGSAAMVAGAIRGIFWVMKQWEEQRRLRWDTNVRVSEASVAIAENEVQLQRILRQNMPSAEAVGGAVVLPPAADVEAASHLLQRVTRMEVTWRSEVDN